jgi:hypothetical protein
VTWTLDRALLASSRPSAGSLSSIFHLHLRLDVCAHK